MQTVSDEYKSSINNIIRNRGYIKASIRVINQTAQGNAEVDSGTELSYVSSPENSFDVDAEVTQVYASAENNFTRINNSMYFAPAEDSSADLLNNGIVTDDLMGSVKFVFGDYTSIDIKGLTIVFGASYPTEFTVTNGNVTYTYTNGSSTFICEDTFDETSYIEITPTEMLNGDNSRMRIYNIYFGIVNNFTNEQVKKFNSKDYVSSITDSIPSMDMSITVDNQDQYYNPDNDESTIAYLESGQEVIVRFGYELDDSTIEWLPEITGYLSDWSANDTEATFTATDRFAEMTGSYLKGAYYESGVSLYALAEAVLTDAGLESDEYYIDPYLENVTTKNPLPICTHSEALQIIANAGRCVLYQDRTKKIHLQSSFLPDMTVTSNGETDYSNVENILDTTGKEEYAISSNDFTTVDNTLYFMPSDSTYLFTGYVSSECADSDGAFTTNPTITITLEASSTFYGFGINFRNTAPSDFTITTYYAGTVQDTVSVTDNTSTTWGTSEQSSLIDTVVIEFTKGYENSRIVIDSVQFGDITDYDLTRDYCLTASPTARRTDRIKSISVLTYTYNETSEEKTLKTEAVTVDVDSPTHIITFSNPVHDLSASVIDESGATVTITESGAYYAVLTFSGLTEDASVEYSVTGYEFNVSSSYESVIYNEQGTEVTWKNPLISNDSLAADVIDWLSNYYLGEVEYVIPWRGDPRTDANDLFNLELKTGEETLIRAYQNELSFNGAWSGNLKARKVVL